MSADVLTSAVVCESVAQQILDMCSMKTLIWAFLFMDVIADDCELLPSLSPSFCPRAKAGKRL